MRPMSDHHQTGPAGPDITDAEIVEDDGAAVLQGPVAREETVDAVPVLAEVRTIETTSNAALPAVQAAAAAATGFVAGAATLALVRRHTARKHARTRRHSRAVDALPIIGSRSFLVDVHLIKPAE